jgi:methylglutaconyl-CoA hydratase
MNTSLLIAERPDDRTAILTLNRPERRNALTIELMESLCETLAALAQEPLRRVVVLRGAGPAFCAGLDLYEAAETDLAQRSAEWVARTFQAVAESPLATIAAVHGAAYAGGAGLMACCDLVVAADDLRICFPEVRRGLVAALAAAALRGRVCDGDLRELLLLAEPIDAQQALAMGLVERIVPGPRLLAESQSMAATLLRGGPDAIRDTKHLLRDLATTDRERFFATALQLHKRARSSDEAREGLAAFAERRPPAWSAGIE